MKRETHFVRLAEKAASGAAEAIRGIRVLEARMDALEAAYDASGETCGCKPRCQE